MSKSQNTIILDALLAGRKLTARQCSREFNIDRLSARIYDLQKEGHQINNPIVKLPSGKRVTEYSYKFKQPEQLALFENR